MMFVSIMSVFRGAAFTVANMITGAAIVALMATLGVLPVTVTASQTATQAPLSASVVTVSAPDRTYAPGVSEPFYAVHIAPEDMDMESGAPLTLQGVAIQALLNDGAIGAVNDSVEAVYVRVSTVADFGYGTVTVTAYGPRICVDGVVRCTGTEFDPWSPEI